MEAITHTYHLPLVLLSIVIAILSSYASLELAGQIKKTDTSARYMWLVTGSLALGLGIWSMHFIAMLAFHLSIPVSYQMNAVLISILPAVTSSALAFFLISKPIMRRAQILLGGLFIAAGVVCMHYLGMEAMKMGAVIEYDPLLFTASVIIAFIAAITALYLLFYTEYESTSQIKWRKVVSAFVMGLAISGMHYTGMASADFVPHDHHQTTGIPIEPMLLAIPIGSGILVILGFVFISTFIDRRFKHQTQLSERKFRSVIESANDAIILSDSSGRIISWNEGAEKMFGYMKQEALGSPLSIIIPKKYQEAHSKGMQRYLETSTPHVIGRSVELEGRRKNDSVFPIELSLAAWSEDKLLYFSSIIRDITERKRTEEKMNQLVYLDPLTGLPNRMLLSDRFSHALKQASEHKTNLGILFLDIDRFKYINDTLGHAVGDQLLIQIAKILEQCTGAGHTVCRQGGDEFILLLADTTADKIMKTAQTVLAKFDSAIWVDDYELYVTPSIGISVYPSDGADMETLIKNADIAMYRVKEQGKNHFQFYTPEMNDRVMKEMQLEIGLRKALEQQEFELVYQPQIDVRTGTLTGAEALIRWHHPEWGTISPAEFIPIAEETGLILPIGEWVLREACLQNKKWQREGHPPIRISVNISSRQFQQNELVAMVQNILNTTELEPRYLELELTESIIQDSTHAVEKMQQLKNMGIHLSIDDFGTGYSSLSYLKTFPINTLKIDRSFTSNIYNDPKDASLVETIITMAHNLDLKVIAEGVETQEQLSFLQQRQCNEAQGYYFSQPIASADMDKLLKNHKTVLS
ncbi:EAL domain-containing protein [Fictibacillus iocasae]|uniref:EAL domain-containing protein n=1 Tax=Fictibacillus iocasae TaxID=2715437 RepID=A0ABW2NQG0_9BACL